jgi:hypothetical protein
MNSQAFESTRQVEFLTELVNSHTEVAGDILQIGASTWAIYGSVPVDGDVLVAEYDSFESAEAALAQLPPNWVADGHADREQRDAPSLSLAVAAMSDGISLSTDPHSPVGAPAYSLGRNSATWRAALEPHRPT